MDEILYTYIGEEHWQDQKNHGQISPGELRRGGIRYPIRVDIYKKVRHLGHLVCVCGSREDATGNPFFLIFYSKKTPLTHSGRYKYDASQKHRIGNTESGDVCKGKVPKFSVGKRGTNLERDGGMSMLQL